MSQAQNPQKPKVIALIVAAGSGSRMGKDMPKQYLPLGGKTVLRHCLETFRRHPRISGVRVVINDALRDLYEPDRINVAAIGNIVNQLHIHVVARTTTDAAWPGVVWGHGTAEPYGDAALAQRIGELRAVLSPP